MTNRASIQPTYDRQQTGDRFMLESRLAGRRIAQQAMPDPFVTHRVVIGWRDLLRGLVHRRLEVEVIVGGDPGIVEDVCELDSDYLGARHSSRRREWDEQLERSLGDFVAREGEHDVT